MSSIALTGSRQRIGFLYLNIGHFLDHLFILIFATVAALRLADEWGMTYGELIPYATPGFVAFGVCAIPAGWLADRWSREGMMAVFFIGIGACAVLSGLASTPFQIALTLMAVGVFAAIYHPVGLAMVVEGRSKTGVALAINGVFGNMGVAVAALLTGFLIDTAGWRSAYFVPGAISIAVGVAYVLFIRNAAVATAPEAAQKKASSTDGAATIDRNTLLRIFALVLFTTAIGGLVFQSTTFSLPKIFDERLTDIAGTATMVGWYAFLAFSIAAFAQLVVGYLIDHHSLRAVFAVVALTQAVLFFAMTHLDGWLSLVVAIGFMLAVFGQIPINDVLVGRIARSEWRSRAYAMRYIVTFSVSASAVPVIAWVHSARGFSALFEILTVSAFIIFVAVLFLPDTRKL